MAFLLQKSSQSFYQALGLEFGQTMREAAFIRGKLMLTYVEDDCQFASRARLREVDGLDAT